jgi:ribosomal protein S6
MKNTVNREYKTTFILDLRETEDDVAKVSADITEILSSLGASVSESEDLGIKEFARACGSKF